MRHFESLKQEIEDGIVGKNSGIPMGFRRLNNHVSIRKSMYYLLGGYSGSGKTALLDDAFVLNPLDYLLRHPSPDLDMQIIYFSMERRKNFKLAKWMSRRIFLDEGVVIPVARILGWVDKDSRVKSPGIEYDLLMRYEDYIEEMMERIIMIEGPQNPTGARKFIEKEYAPKHGVLDESDKYHPIYHAHKPNKITLVLSDHIGLTKGEKEFPRGKAAIDKASEDKQRWRDLYGFSPVDVSQFNRDIANPTRLKNGDVEPMMEDFKDTGVTQENADIVLSLFDPMRYKVPDPSGYDLTRLVDNEGKKKYRSLKILKNSYGSDDIRIGLAFQPEVGMFKEAPRIKDMQSQDYDNILDNSYFLTN